MKRHLEIGPSDTLRKVSHPVDDFGPAFQELVDDMTEMMRRHRGVGISAPQVGELQRVILVYNGIYIATLVNPVVTGYGGAASILEGCLSLPDVRTRVPRLGWVSVTAQDRFGKPTQYDGFYDGTNITSIILQHEMDHLDGRLITDYMACGSEAPTSM